MSTIDAGRDLDARLAAYIAEVNENVGQVKPVPAKRTEHHEYTLNYRYVTDDLIRMFAVAVGDANPLWRDAAA